MPRIIGEAINTKVSLTNNIKMPKTTRIPLSGFQMKQLNPDARLMRYTDLYHYKTSKDLFKDTDKIVLLYLTTSNTSGHYVGLFKNKNGVINYFDSYGMPMDYHFELLSNKLRNELNEPVNYLQKLL